MATLCGQVRLLDSSLTAARQVDEPSLIPGLRQARNETANQYNDMMVPIQGGNQGGTFGLPDQIGDKTPDCVPDDEEVGTG